MFVVGHQREVRAKVPVKSEASFAFFPCLSSNQKSKMDSDSPLLLNRGEGLGEESLSSSQRSNPPPLHYSIPGLDFKGFQELSGINF
jgi:hypothetical protein